MKKGLFYTLGILLLILPLILLVAYYTVVPQTKTDDTISKIRCDELHYFVEDVRADMERALVIFGRRAAIYAIDDVVKRGEPLDDYVFNCSSGCHVDCGSFRLGVNGSEAAVSELIMCGTLRGENVTYMTNHTLSQWLTRIEQHGRDMHFNVSVNLTDMVVMPKDPWTFYVESTSTFSVYDESGTCFYVGSGVTTSSSSSIIGLEDPLFPLETNGYVQKYIINCSSVIRTERVAGCSAASENPGVGIATGYVVFDSKLSNPDQYCLNTIPGIINNQVLVLDKGFGSCNQYDPDCFNISSPHHFAGILDYGPNSPNSFVKKCNVTIPWLRDTGDVDNITPQSPPRRVDECAGADIYNASCVKIYNSEYCNLHQILVGYSPKEINTTCYWASNASLYPGGFDGPSFFDKLDGNLRLTDKYRNQSRDYFNVTFIGLETLINPYDFDDHGVKVLANATWVDYLYWNSTHGCAVQGICGDEKYLFRLDNAHAKVLQLDTECVNATPCSSSAEVCVDGQDQDNDTKPDWLDPDCLSYFPGCGIITSCDPTDSDSCSSCTTNQLISENTPTYCPNYGYNTSEWHFYSVIPTSDGLLGLIFNGTSNATGDQKTDLAIYNYSASSCGGSVSHLFNMERNFMTSYCVQAGKTYVFGLDSDAPKFGYNGTYTFSTRLNALDPTCPTYVTTTTTTTTTTSTTTTTLCGFFDDFDGADKGWTTGGAMNDWQHGQPKWRSADGKKEYSSPNCWGIYLPTGPSSGYYENGANASLKSPLINLASASSSKLIFQMKYDIEYYNTTSGVPHGDRGFVEASNDGTTWTKLATYTNTPPPEHCQDGWLPVTLDINAYRGGLFLVRYRLESDSSIVRQGLYIDDVNVTCH
jgi:hypothetical protein